MYTHVPFLPSGIYYSHVTGDREKAETRVLPESYKRVVAEWMKVYNYAAFALSGIPSCAPPMRWK